MDNRRIAIYLNSRIPTAKIQLNHLYTSKIDQIIFKEGITKVEAARNLLMKSFQTNDISELKERIFYAASMYEFKKTNPDKLSVGIGSKVGHICKIALRRAIDTY